MSERNPDHCYDCGIYIGGKSDDHYCLDCEKDRCQQESEGVVVEVVQGTVQGVDYDLDYFYYVVKSPELLSLGDARLTRIEGEE